MIVSEGFLRLLAADARAQFEARPVEWETKRRKKFYEIIPKAFISEVAIKGHEIAGWCCEACGRRNFSHGRLLGWGVSVICRSDLPSPLPPIFFVGDRTDVRLYRTRTRWRQLCGKPGTRKMLSFPLAVVDEQSCVRQPRVPTMEEVEESRRRHGSDKWVRLDDLRDPNTHRGLG